MSTISLLFMPLEYNMRKDVLKPGKGFDECKEDTTCFSANIIALEEPVFTPNNDLDNPDLFQ